MSRWHEPTCIRPDVVVTGGIPCCRWCYAVACIDDVTFAPPLSTTGQAYSGDDNGRYQLHWPKCVDYIGQDESSSAVSAFLPSSTRDVAGDQQEHPKDHEGSSPSQSLPNKIQEVAQVPKGRNSTKDESYRPSRCYPIFWSNDEIRLLELDSDTSDSLLHGAFIRVELGSEQAQYEAISYTWADASGDSTRCKPIFIGPFWDIIPITRNCENALRSVRISTGLPRRIWIDSICINQDDKKERSAQVALMPRIYAGAAGVLVYLGTATRESDLAMDTIAHSENHDRCIHQGRRIGLCEKCLRAVENLFQRPFFSRLWVVQEVTLAQSSTIFCGSKSTSWPPHQIADYLYSSSWRKSYEYSSSWKKSYEQSGGEPGRALLGLMVATSKSVCSDRRDRVFALLGMLHGLEAGEITADYSLTPQEVSIGIASFLVQKCNRGRDVPLWAGVNRVKSRRLPSWVPDFVEPLNPDGRIMGLIQRSDTMSRNAEVRNKRLFLPSPRQTTVQIHARTASLCLTAVKLCNLRSSFKPFGPGLNAEPFVRHGSTQRAIIVVPKAPDGFKNRSGWLSIISQQDGLYWLHGIEGFAILRPNVDRDSYSLICGCDVYFETVEDPYGKQQDTRVLPDHNWTMLLQPLSGSDEETCAEQLQRLFRDVSLHWGTAGLRRKRWFDVSATELLLNVAFMLQKSPRQAVKLMWQSWQILERRLLPLFHSDQGLHIILKCLEPGVNLRCGTEDDGRPKEIYAFQDCYMQSFEPIAALIWSILPSRELQVHDDEDPEVFQTSSTRVMKDLKDWADLTRNLFSALDTPPSVSKDIAAVFHSIMGTELLNATRHLLSSFRLSMNPRCGNISEPLLSLVTTAYTKARMKHLLWDWSLFKIDMVKWEIFWKTMDEDTWLRSWRVNDGGHQLERDIRERSQQASKCLMSVLEPPEPRMATTLEEQMYLRLRLREFDFNIDSSVMVKIR